MPKEINDLELSVIVPKHDNSGNKINPSEVKDVAEEMSEEFGGVSIDPSVLGCWKSEDKGLICEENMRVSTSLDTEDPDSPSRAEGERIVQEQAKNLGEELGQAAIMTTQEKSEVSFVEGEFRDEVDETKRQDVFDEVL